MSILIATVNGQAMTTSLAIAEGTGVQHKNVLETVRHYHGDLGQFGGVAFRTDTFDTPGGQQLREVAVLNERQATLLLTYMRNSPVVRSFKTRLVRAFYEMQQSRPPAPAPAELSRMDLLQLAMDAERERLVLAARVDLLEPKAEALDRISAATGELCLRDAAKTLGMPPLAFNHWLVERRWIFKQTPGSPYSAFADRCASGVMTHRVAVIGTHDDGSEKIARQAVVTPKGLAMLATLRARDELACRQHPPIKIMVNRQGAALS